MLTPNQIFLHIVSSKINVGNDNIKSLIFFKSPIYGFAVLVFNTISVILWRSVLFFLLLLFFYEIFNGKYLYRAMEAVFDPLRLKCANM